MKAPEIIVERTKNRASRALVRDGKIVIRLARRLSAHEEREHIAWLLKRMERVWARESVRTSVDPFRPLLEGAQELLVETNLGKTWRFVLQPSSRATVKVRDDVVTLGVPERLDQKRLHRHLWNTLAWLMRENIEQFVHSCNERTFQSPLSAIKIRAMTSQWGSCSSRGVVTLNPALLMIEKELLEYVVIHELAHTLHKNHSVRFWAAVSEYCDNFTERRKNLNQKRIIKL
jgi:predicted metal-dependent hydrolase